MLKFYTNLSRSSLELYDKDIAFPEIDHPVKVTNDYLHLNASYRELLNDQLGIRMGVSYTGSEDFSSIDLASQRENLKGFHSKVAFDYQHSDRLAIVAGAEVIGTNQNQRLVDGDAWTFEFNERITAAFTEAEIFASSDLAFKVGLRAEHNSLTGNRHFDPRLSAAYKTGENSQVSMAYGQFHQAPERQLTYLDHRALEERARHYIANYQWSAEGRTFRIEAYDKQYANLARYTNIFNPSTYSFDGDGHSRGIDVFWRDSKSIANTDFWVSYSFLDTKRSYLNFPGSFTPSFASAHNFSLVVKKFINSIKSQVGWTYSFASS
ncbi:MAG: TonB-dependent receptor, partial [Bacteroidota bacterium]